MVLAFGNTLVLINLALWEADKTVKAVRVTNTVRRHFKVKGTLNVATVNWMTRKGQRGLGYHAVNCVLTCTAGEDLFPNRASAAIVAAANSIWAKSSKKPVK